MSMALLSVRTTERRAGRPARAAAEDRTVSGPAAVGVAWASVLPLAAALSYADGFWMTSLRGAVGAIERTQGPFASWLRESTVLLPLFATAVLGAFALAVRLFGPVLRGFRTVLATALLISLAGTAAGMAAVTASAAYDYHLQTEQLRFMDAMGAVCTGSCRAAEQQLTFDVQLRAVGYAAALLLVTNVVLVLWMLAMRGGRLRVSRFRPAAVPVGSGGEAVPVEDTVLADGPCDRTRELGTLLAITLLAGAVVHTAVVPGQRAEWPLAGVFFMLLSATQAIVAYRVLVERSARSVVAAVLVTAGPLALWALSRTSGLPFGPHSGHARPLGLTDGVAALLELATVLCALALARAARSSAPRPAAGPHVRALVLTAVIAAAIIAVAGTQLSLFGDFASAGYHAVTHVHG